VPPFLQLNSRTNLPFRILVYYAAILILPFHIINRIFFDIITNITVMWEKVVLYHLLGIFSMYEFTAPITGPTSPMKTSTSCSTPSVATDRQFGMRAGG
jgi:hypothetical protein